MAWIHRLRVSALALLFCVPLAACDDPCGDLEKKVCLEMKDKRRCKILRQPDRKENLSAAACESMLEHISKR